MAVYVWPWRHREKDKLKTQEESQNNFLAIVKELFKSL